MKFVFWSLFWGFLVGISLSILVWTRKNKISPMPTSIRVKKRLFEVLPESMEGTIYELGSGWGTLAFPLAKKYPHSAIVAFETSPIPYLFSQILHFFSSSQNLAFYKKDFLKVPLQDASLIVCYLYPEAMKNLKKKFEAELTPGSLIITHTFSIPGWRPIAIHEVKDLYKTKIYFYKI